MHRVSLAKESEAIYATVAEHQHVSSGTLTTRGLITAPAVNVSGSVSAGSASISGHINTGTLTASGAIDAQVSGVVLSAGQPALSGYMTATTTSLAFPLGGVSPLGGSATGTFVRIGRLVIAHITYLSPGAISVYNEILEFRNFIPLQFRPASQSVLPAIVFTPDAVDESQLIGASVVSDAILFGRLGFGGNPLSGFSENGPITIYGATLTWIVSD